MNKRLMATLAGFVVFLALACLFAFVASAPAVQEKNESLETATVSVQNTTVSGTETRRAKLIEEAAATKAWEESKTAEAVANAAATEAARPTVTWTPSPTITPLPTVVWSDCSAIMKAKGKLYAIPASGWQKNVEVNRGDKLSVLARIEDGGFWYVVRHNGVAGWLQKDFLESLSCPDALISLDGLVHSLTYVHGQSFISDTSQVKIQDTFFSNTYRWSDNAGTLLDLKLGITAIQETKTIVANNMDDLNGFNLAMAFERENNDNAAYIGVRYTSFSGKQLEIQLASDCKVTLIEGETRYPPKQIPGTCAIKGVTYLETRLKDANIVVSVNGETGIPFSLEENYGPGRLSLVVYNARAKFHFFVLTIPQ